jgi:hypothetical protein
MAKASPQSYQVTNLSDISYLGKVAPMGSVVNDIPGEDITWLLADGWIVPSSAPSADPAPAPEATPDVTPDAEPADSATPEAGA